MKNKIIEILTSFDVKPSYAQTAIYDQSIGGFRKKLATRIMEQLVECYVEVKCKDELPEEGYHFCGRDDNGYRGYLHYPLHWESGITWWLKKLPPHPKEEPKDSGWISVGDIGPFAKWREDNRWFNFEDGKWKYTFEHGTMISDKSYKKNYTKTTTELFQMYIESIEAAGLPPTVETKKD